MWSVEACELVGSFCGKGSLAGSVCLDFHKAFNKASLKAFEKAKAIRDKGVSGLLINWLEGRVVGYKR